MQKDEVIYVCSPCYSSPDPRQARQFWGRCVHPSGPLAHIGRVQDITGDSALTNTFNGHWCNALNLQREGVNITRWAMLHTDVVPCDWWLDILNNDLEQHGADVMSAVIPIKDGAGKTSTAIDDPEDPWNPLRRITMTELFTLPKVFTAGDCRYPNNHLLVNTGCFIADFTKDWRKHVCFDVQSKIDVDANGRHVSLFRPEDWNFSRSVAELGGKVMATRNVYAVHVGKMDYGNGSPWGSQRWDEEYSSKFLTPIGSTEPVVRGWLTHEEGTYLQSLAVGRRVLEIGSYCGKSSIYLARTAHELYCIDTFNGDAVGLPPHDTYKEFNDNLTRHGVQQKVTVIQANSRDRPHVYGKFDLVFIDSDHSYDAVKSDIEYATGLMASGGVLAFHDYRSAQDPDVTRAVNELLSNGARLIGSAGSVIAISSPV